MGAVDARVAVDPEPETFVCDLVDDALAKLHDVFLQGFVARRVIEHLPNDARVAGPQDIPLRDTHKVTVPETRHKRIV